MPTEHARARRACAPHTRSALADVARRSLVCASFVTATGEEEAEQEAEQEAAVSSTVVVVALAAEAGAPQQRAARSHPLSVATTRANP